MGRILPGFLRAICVQRDRSDGAFPAYGRAGEGTRLSLTPARAARTPRADVPGARCDRSGCERRDGKRARVRRVWEELQDRSPRARRISRAPHPSPGLLPGLPPPTAFSRAEPVEAARRLVREVFRPHGHELPRGYGDADLLRELLPEGGVLKSCEP